ncbi:MAG: glycosyltransferase family 1 protein [Pseudomonadota bacterium]|nr:glycosyltransferase family 1 protein [Pseudomonadota bacterium]
MLSAHDYRSPRRANIHFITDELAKRGRTRFFSLKYSELARRKGDWRSSLDAESNQVVRRDGVDCYLWKTWIHPFNTRRPLLYPLESLLHQWYARGPNPVLKRWIQEASIVVMESGVAPIFVPLVRRLNPQARILYRASDSLKTIDVASYVQRMFARVASQFHAICLPSRMLAAEMPDRNNLAFVPHGIDQQLRARKQPNPYPPGTHGVSVGSMLFDPQFFVAASRRFPSVQFHIIGCGQPPHKDYGPNVRVYGEMPFEETLAYIRHADFGIAPYCSNNLPPYLKDTSMKLIQYEFFGIPAVCPEFVADGYASRCGYQIGNADSITAAIETALATSLDISTSRHLNWSEVTDRVLYPEHYADTVIT